MAYDSNMGFHQGMVPSSFYDRHMVSFQSGAVCSSKRIIPTTMNSVGALNSMEGMFYSESPPSNNTSLMIPSGDAAGVLHLDPMPELRHDTGLAVDWSLEEQLLLEKGLEKYSDEPNIMKYIKIAATLRSKTIRDVALRCRWMTNKENGKRRKQDEYHTGKKMKDRKVVCSSRANVASSQPLNIPACSFMMHRADISNGIACEVSSIDSAAQLLLEENTQLLCQIEHNLDTLKLQDNIDLFFLLKKNVDLFFHTRNNITAIQNRTSDVPGIIRMPPLPEPVDESLLDTLLGVSQALMFNSPGGIHLSYPEEFVKMQSMI